MFQPANGSPRAAAGPTQGCVAKSWGYRCFYGPYEASYDPNEEHNEYGLIPTPPEAGYITSAHATLVDEQGDSVSRHEAHLHHVVFINPNKPSLMCPNIGADLFFASGKERTKLQLPDGYGYYWDNKGPPQYPAYTPTWAIVHHLMTMHEGHETDVFVKLDLGFEAVPEGSLIDVKPTWFDVAGEGDDCSLDPVFNVQKGSGTDGVFQKSRTLTMPEGGHFIAFGGHLHDGGLKLRLDNDTTGEKVWTAHPTYGPAEGGWDLRKISSYSGAPGFPVTAQDQMRLTASYDSTHRWHKVMGIMVGVMAPGVEQGPYRLP